MSVIAAAFHPKFRLVWLEKHNQAHVPRDTKAMETAVETGLQEHEMAQEANSTASSIDEDDDFFSGITGSENNGEGARGQYSDEHLIYLNQDESSYLYYYIIRVWYFKLIVHNRDDIVILINQ